jgi:hypothetical protein
MPKSAQGKAKQLIHEMYLAPTRKPLWWPMISLSPVIKFNFPKPANACTQIEKCCLPFTISRPNIGRIYGALIISNYWLRVLLLFITIGQRRKAGLWLSLHVALRTFVGI